MDLQYNGKLKIVHACLNIRPMKIMKSFGDYECAGSVKAIGA